GGGGIGLGKVGGGDEGMDRAARDVFHVDSRALAQFVDERGIEPPALQGQPIVGGASRLAERREETGRRARGFGARRRALEERDRAAGLGQLVRRRAADDAAADDGDLHATTNASRKRRTASAGDGASRIAAIAATPWAPAARTSPTRAGVIPPMAITGIRTRPLTFASASRPCGAP